MILAAWKAKPQVVQQLTLVWGLMALQSLIYAGLSSEFGNYWNLFSDGAGLYICLGHGLVTGLFCGAHLRAKHAAWFYGTLISFVGIVFSAQFSFEAIKSLISFLETGYASSSAAPSLNFGGRVNLPVLALSFCGLTCEFILMLAAFFLAISRPARLAYGAQT